MTPRQPDMLSRVAHLNSSDRTGALFVAAFLPVIFGLLTLVALLTGVSVAATALLCAVGSVACSAAFFLVVRTRPQGSEVAAPVPSEVNEERLTKIADTPEPLPELAAQAEYLGRRLQYAQMIEITNSLIGVITHDLNNRLTVINSNIDTVASQLGDQPVLRRKLTAALAAVERSSVLMAKLAAFTSQKSWALQTIDLSEQLASDADLIRRSLLSEAIRMEVHCPDDVWPVEIDPDHLQMAIINITLNARDAMPRGGKIRIAAENVSLRDDTLKLYGRFVRISVEDTGVGIPPEHLGKVFQPFFTTKELRNGVGLGLIQVKNMALRAGGDVVVESIPEQGTTVSIYLPRAETAGAEEPATASPTTPDGPDEGPQNDVLVVDDEEDVAVALKNMVTQLGHTVCIAHTPAAALDIIKISRPGVVLTDITMPGTMDGIALGRQLRHRYPHMPIILMTGNPLAISESTEFSVLLKPITTEKLKRALQSHLPVRQNA